MVNLNEEEFFEELEDMVFMSKLDEGMMVKNLNNRYEKQLIYTYVGNILIAVNPYMLIDIYNMNEVEKYEGSLMASEPPHLFAVANAAFTNLRDSRERQVVVISGESGAGKTESTKLLMHYLAMTCNNDTTDKITDKVLEASPILESFGNAQTIRNDNSSRFGKYVELFFKKGSLVGANTSEYLLEKSRIIKQWVGERNYHIFYEMIHGLDSETKKKLSLISPQQFAYLNYGEGAILESRNDVSNFTNLQLAFQLHQFSSQDSENIYKILASVLHLGNIDFKKAENIHRLEGVSVESEDQVKIVADLLKLNLKGLIFVLTARVTEARNEKLVTPLTNEQATDVRDAIAKSLYHHMFRWLVEKINKNMMVVENNLPSIAILDIFGFEDLQYNSFEQLCINYANEALQFYFNKYVFKIEQEEYEKEGVCWQTVDFVDNQPVIDLIGKKPKGIFSILDEESNFPNGSDFSFLEKCHSIHSKGPFYLKPRMNNPTFGIKHYTGTVNYNVSQFLDKNRDTLKGDVVTLMLESNENFISLLFGKNQNKDINRKNLKISSTINTNKSSKIISVSAKFNESLHALLENMTRCNPWFIRCIKPNNTKTPMSFEQALVLTQLRATGMLETIKIRKMGFPVRLKFSAFAKRFKLLLPIEHYFLLKAKKEDDANLREACVLILKQVPQEWSPNYQVGKTKVFLKETMPEKLMLEVATRLSGVVLVFQKYTRGFLARVRFKGQMKAVLTFQTLYRTWQSRKNFFNLKKNIVRSQAFIKGFIIKRNYLKMKKDKKFRMEEDEKLQLLRYQEEKKKRKSKMLEELKSPEIQSLLDTKDPNAVKLPPQLSNLLSSKPELLHQKNLSKVSNVANHNLNLSLPPDIETFELHKYADVYCKETLPLVFKGSQQTPILALTTEFQTKQALDLSRLVYRFLKKSDASSTDQRLLSYYITSNCINNDYLKDEIYLQLVNKTFIEKNEKVLNRIWFLMSLCLSSFIPSSVLSNYLLKYISVKCTNNKTLVLCQQKFLQAQQKTPDFLGLRNHCHSYLEWGGVDLGLPLALQAQFYDGKKMLGELGSWTNCEDLAKTLLSARGLAEEAFGWSVDLHEGEHCLHLSATDYVFDAINEVEKQDKLLLGTKAHYLVSGHIPSKEKVPHFVDRQRNCGALELKDFSELTEFVVMPPRSPVFPNFSLKKKTQRSSQKQDPIQSLPICLSEKSNLNMRYNNIRYVQKDENGYDKTIYATSLISNQQVHPQNPNQAVNFSSNNLKKPEGDKKKEGKGLRRIGFTSNETNYEDVINDIFQGAVDEKKINKTVKRIKGGEDEIQKTHPTATVTFMLPPNKNPTNQAKNTRLVSNADLKTLEQQNTEMEKHGQYLKSQLENKMIQNQILQSKLQEQVLTQQVISSNISRNSMIDNRDKEYLTQNGLYDVPDNLPKSPQNRVCNEDIICKKPSTYTNVLINSSSQNSVPSFKKPISQKPKQPSPVNFEKNVEQTTDWNSLLENEVEKNKIKQPMNPIKRSIINKEQAISTNKVEDSKKKFIWPPVSSGNSHIQEKKKINKIIIEENIENSLNNNIKKRAFIHPKEKTKLPIKLQTTEAENFYEDINSINNNEKNVKPLLQQTPSSPRFKNDYASNPSPSLTSILKSYSQSNSSENQENKKYPTFSTAQTSKQNDSILNHSNPQSNFSSSENQDLNKMTEEDLEDDRDYFNIKQMENEKNRPKLVDLEVSQYLTYSGIPWKLMPRKELFTPNELLTSPALIELIFMQILFDLNKPNCIKITNEDRELLKKKLYYKNLKHLNSANLDNLTKQKVIEVAKMWPFYFARIYSVNGGSRLPQVELLSISHQNLKLVKRVNSEKGDVLKTLQTIKYNEIVDVSVPKPMTLQIHYNSDKYVALYFKEANKIKELIDAFCIECEKNSVFVKAIEDYQTREPMLLSFKKGDIIKLTAKNDVLSKDWLYGTIHGRIGMFPCECVTPILVHEAQYAALKSVNIDTSHKAFKTDTMETLEKMNQETQLTEARRKYIMLDFALKLFRRPLPSNLSNIKDLKKKDSLQTSWQDLIPSITWTKTPIEDSLLKISSDKLNKLATDCFINIMQFMGEYPPTERDPVSEILTCCQSNSEMIDEIYCQLIKQTTNNNSAKQESCQQGWRLMSFLTSYFKCSPELNLFLLRHLEETALDNRRAHYMLAESCLHNFRQTSNYGGRKIIPSETEIFSVKIGRGTRQMACTLTDGLQVKISLQTSTVARDVVEQICEQLGIINFLEVNEYIIYIVYGSGRNFYPLEDGSYMMDVITDFVNNDRPFQFLFRRFIWVSPLELDRDPLYIHLIFEQTKPDYLDGFLLDPSSKTLSSDTKDDIASMCALLLQINGKLVEPQNKILASYVEKCIPKNVFKMIEFNLGYWTKRMKEFVPLFQNLEPLHCQIKFLKIISKWRMFNSTIFPIGTVSDNRVSGSKSMLAVNKLGLHFFSEKHNILQLLLPFKEILGARLRIDESNKKFLDIRHGDLLVKYNLEVQTSDADAIGLMIDKYIKTLQTRKGSIKNLPVPMNFDIQDSASLMDQGTINSTKFK